MVNRIGWIPKVESIAWNGYDKQAMGKVECTSSIMQVIMVRPVPLCIVPLNNSF